ncbi:MAG: hypothetical protein ACK559_12100, partial [bacterium]
EVPGLGRAAPHERAEGDGAAPDLRLAHRELERHVLEEALGRRPAGREHRHRLQPAQVSTDAAREPGPRGALHPKLLGIEGRFAPTRQQRASTIAAVHGAEATGVCLAASSPCRQFARIQALQTPHIARRRGRVGPRCRPSPTPRARGC